MRNNQYPQNNPPTKKASLRDFQEFRQYKNTHPYNEKAKIIMIKALYASEEYNYNYLLVTNRYMDLKK